MSQSSFNRIERIETICLVLSIFFLIILVCHYVPLLFTGTIPGALEAGRPLGFGTVLRGVPSRIVREFWPLTVSFWFAFSAIARITVAGITIITMLMSCRLSCQKRKSLLAGIILILVLFLILNMVAIFHVFGSG